MSVDLLEQALDHAVLEKELLAEELDVARRTTEDLQLQYTAKLLEKDLAIIALEQKLVQGDTASGSLNRDTADANNQLAPEGQAYKKAFETVKVWHTNLSVEVAVKSADLKTASIIIQKLQQSIVKHESNVEKQYTIIQVLEQVLKNDEEALQKGSELEEEYRRQNEALENELSVFKHSWADATFWMKTQSQEDAQQIRTLTQQLTELQERVVVAEKHLIPRWQRTAEDHALKGGSIPAAVLRADVECFNGTVQRLRQDLLSDCVPSDFWKTELTRMDYIMDMYSCVSMCNNLGVYLNKAHFEELVRAEAINVDSLEKDRGFIRWLQQTTFSISKIKSTVLRLVVTVHSVDFDTFIKLTDSGGPLSVCVPKLVTDLEHLVSISCVDVLSSAAELPHALAAVEELEAAYLPRVEDGGAVPVQVPLLSSVIQRCPITKKNGILVGVVTGILMQLRAVSITGACRAAHTEEIVEAIESESWRTLIQAVDEAIKSVFLAEDASNPMSAKFGVLVPRVDAEEYINQLTAAVQTLEFAMRATDEVDIALIKDRICNVFTVIIPAIQELEYMCAAYVAPPRQHSIGVFKDVTASVREKLSDVVKLGDALKDSASREAEVELRVEQLEKKVKEADAKSKTMHDKMSEVTILAERFEVSDTECKQLRLHVKEYEQLMSKLRVDYSAAVEAKQISSQATKEVSKQLHDAKVALQLSKKIPKRLHQSDWDAMELMHLRAIITKLQRELYEVQLQNAERDMSEINLERFVSNMQLASLNATDDSTKIADELEADFALRGMYGDDVDIEWDDTRKRAEAEREKNVSVNHENATQLVREYTNLRRSIFTHAMQIVPFEWNSSGLKTSAYSSESMSKYKAQNDALHLAVSSLGIKIESYLQNRFGCNAARSGFGERKNLAVSRFLRSYADVAKLRESPSGNSTSAIPNSTAACGLPVPVGHIKTQTPPAWLADWDKYPKLGIGGTGGTGTKCQVFVTPDQLQSVYSSLMGINVAH
eukprot:Lankesteria_metandrocarpae@DN1547_c0_g1_i1.p1